MHGWTTPENATAYQRLLIGDVLPGIAARGLPGYRGAHVLRRDTEADVEFVTILWFDSLDGVRPLAGPEYEAACVPPKERALLARFDARSRHYDTLRTPG